jgi:hypothetical protein
MLAAGSLVDLVDHHHRVGIGAIDQRLEDLARARALPLAGRARQHPARGQAAHRDEAHAGAEQCRNLAREVGLAHARRAEQQHRRDLEGVAAVLRQRELAFEIVQHFVEVGQIVVEVLHRRQAAGLDLEALGPALEHALVGAAQRLVLAPRVRRQARQALVHVRVAEDVPHLRDADLVGRGGGCRHSVLQTLADKRVKQECGQRKPTLPIYPHAAFGPATPRQHVCNKSHRRSGPPRGRRRTSGNGPPTQLAQTHSRSRHVDTTP